MVAIHMEPAEAHGTSSIIALTNTQLFQKAHILWKAAHMEATIQAGYEYNYVHAPGVLCS
jgi:hypothetical protein